MNQSEKQQLHLILGLLVLLISLAVLLTSYLAYSFYKENKEYSEAVSSIQDDGYVFATEIYRLPAKKSCCQHLWHGRCDFPFWG